MSYIMSCGLSLYHGQNGLVGMNMPKDAVVTSITMSGCTADMIIIMALLSSFDYWRTLAVSFMVAGVLMTGFGVAPETMFHNSVYWNAMVHAARYSR
ncbi:hypothetical protein V8C37DRAFT_388657 [Trichoderma ceciliae]